MSNDENNVDQNDDRVTRPIHIVRPEMLAGSESVNNGEGSSEAAESIDPFLGETPALDTPDDDASDSGQPEVGVLTAYNATQELSSDEVDDHSVEDAPQASANESSSEPSPDNLLTRPLPELFDEEGEDQEFVDAAEADDEEYTFALAEDEGDEDEDEGDEDEDDEDEDDSDEDESEGDYSGGAQLVEQKSDTVRHTHSLYEAEIVISENASVFAERQVIIEHKHSLEDEHDDHFSFVERYNQRETNLSRQIEPAITDQFSPSGFIIPRQPEREQGGSEDQIQRDLLQGQRPRKPTIDVRPRQAQPTKAQIDSGYIMVTKSRMPPRLLARQVLAYVERERKMALDVRDPIAIAFAAERFNVLTALLEENGPEEEIDLLKPLLTVSQAAKMLGYNAKELRRLLGQGKVSGRKVGNEWRIPLRAVL